MVAAVESAARLAADPSLFDVAEADGVLALREAAARALEVVSHSNARAKELVEGVCAFSTCCLALGADAGLSSIIVTEIVSEGLAAAAFLFASEEEEARAEDTSVDRIKHHHRSGVARLLEPLGEALDAFTLEVYEGLRRLETVLQPTWVSAGPGFGGRLVCRGMGISEADVHLYEALQAVCVWTLELVTHALGYRHFTARDLWSFTSGDVFLATLFAKAALSFRQADWACSRVRVPEDMMELRDAVLGAVLGLAGQDVAFTAFIECDDTGEDDTDIDIRNEQLLMHRAMLTAAACECDLLDCLLFYPWATGERLPALVAFLGALSASAAVPRASAFLMSLGDQVDTWNRQLAYQSADLWSVVAPMAQATRGFLGACAALAHCAPPSEEVTGAFIDRCLAEEGHCTALEDPQALAALAVFAANSACHPAAGHAAASHGRGVEALARLLAGLSAERRGEVAARLRSWRGALDAEALAPWLELIACPQNITPPPPPPPETPPEQSGGAVASPAMRTAASAVPCAGMRGVLIDAPAHFRCALDGRLLVDPVRSPSGHVFERSVLVRALEASGGVCPLEGGGLSLADCPRDAELRRRVVEWIRRSRKRQCVS